MSKRVLRRIMIAGSLIAFVAIAYGYYQNQKSRIDALYVDAFVDDKKPVSYPNFLSGYPENRTGDYQFDSKIILASIDGGKDIFKPLLEDPSDVSIRYTNIAWSQSDFLRVANALSQRVWGEHLDLDGWRVYEILFSGDCGESSGRFNHFEITYYKTIETGWETIYTARHIELFPWMGVAMWAGDGHFSTNFFQSWRNIELTKFKTTAEQAVRIAEENGGKVARLNVKNGCSVYVNIIDGDWLVDYDTAQFSAFIDPVTGEFHSAK